MRFRRKDRQESTQPEAVEETTVSSATDPAGEASEDESRPGVVADPTSQGPFDVADVDATDGSFIDLGSLLLPAHEDFEVQLQVDEESGQVMAVLVGNERGAIEMRAFAAARNDNLWDEARDEIAADATRQGGTVEQGEGPFGPELRCMMPVELPDGSEAVQPSRVLGYNGPRWFLRATLLGEPAIEPDSDAQFIDYLRAVAVRRGTDAMPPGEALHVHVPQDAVEVRPPDDPGDETA